MFFKEIFRKTLLLNIYVLYNFFLKIPRLFLIKIRKIKTKLFAKNTTKKKLFSAKESFHKKNVQKRKIFTKTLVCYKYAVLWTTRHAYAGNEHFFLL